MFDNARRVRRSLRVARTGARIYLGYKRTQRKVRKLGPEAAAIQWEQRHEAAAESLYRLAVDLKGMYIKSGQFIGTRTDIVPLPYTRSLSRLQDQVPARPMAVVRHTIESELKRPLEELFATFDEEPIGAASLAQVHRATLPDGREVVVKVQYPEVAGLVRLDVRNLRTLVGIVARREPNFDFRAVVNEIGSQVPLELDFEREAALHRLLAQGSRLDLIASAHDCGDGGLAIALTESAIAGGTGFAVVLGSDAPWYVTLFSESASRAVVSVTEAKAGAFEAFASELGVPAARLGETGGPRMVFDSLFETTVEETTAAYEEAIPKLLG